jgi:iron complex transport system substrate-binding protein
MKMRKYLLSFLALLFLFAFSAFALGAVPGDLDGEKIVSQGELQKAEEQLKDGKISAEQMEEIKHIKENYPRTLVDSANRTITIYKPIERITEELLAKYLGGEYDAKNHGVFVYPLEAV